MLTPKIDIDHFHVAHDALHSMVQPHATCEHSIETMRAARDAMWEFIVHLDARPGKVPAEQV